MSAITIFHNPGCGTSRTVLQALQDGGHAPQVVEYLKAGWSEDQLRGFFAQMGVTPRQMLRVRGTPAEALGLTEPDATDEQILQAMIAHPVLVERPILITRKGVFLCRPAERLEGMI
jgi:arsenate reductase